MASAAAPEAQRAWLPAWSVALCTYNGAPYIEEQLRSILDAGVQCSQIVVIDDASSDGTVEMVRAVARSTRIPFCIEVNAENIGSARSFQRALLLTAAPIVFLADQDDLWDARKPARMLEEFARRPHLLLLHGDARLVDDDGNDLGTSLFDAIEVTAHERATIHFGDAFDVFIKRNLATGATLALRRSLLDIALPIPNAWVHDEWLATIASAIGTVDFIEEPLTLYRQHGKNQIGARRLSLKEKINESTRRHGDYYIVREERAAVLLERLIGLGPTAPPDRVMKARAKLAHMHFRKELPRNHAARVGPVLLETLSGKYRRYSTGWKSIVRDLFHTL